MPAMTANTRTTEHPIHPQFTQRWSPRAFSGEALGLEQLLPLFEAARWAPSASNTQPWRFVYGLAGTPAFAGILDGLVPFNQAWAGQAGALVVVISATQSVPPGQSEAKPLPWHALDTGAAWMSLALQAQASGLAAHAMGGFDAAKLRDTLAVPATHELHAVVAIGRQGDAATLPEALRARELPSPRRPLSALVAEGRFSLAD